MVRFYTFRYIIFLPIFVICFDTLAADSRSSFYFKNFSKDSNFESQLNLYGDSKVGNDSLCVEITGSWFNSAGRVVYKKPFRLLEGKPSSLVSFSTYFSFSMSQDSGDGLVFFMVPVGFDLNEFDGGSFGLLGGTKMRFLSVEFDTFKDRKYGDLDDNHVGIDVDGFVSVKVSNVSFVNLVLNNGEKLQAWIDYEASSKKLEVRLSKLGHVRPVDPLLSYSIDVSKIWKEDEVFVGLSSSNGNSLQKCSVCSWSFKARQAPQWMHSEPLDPEKAVVEKTKVPTVHKRSDCFLKVLAALIVGTACGALGTFFVLFVWTISGASKRPVVPVLPEQYAVHPEEFEYNKFKIVVEEGKK
ncbi:Alpha-amylase inhibitor alpha subunit family protein [Heracleum sosnowskyi]|uniref:Alpha-amylase inhibitor alpha subunit family protein n=1 Tax=Heracleum sosnowskyi TaxID=360622 RepID=A0AAD8I2V3_9APIA|nr:Alpha-amylase inhibitor alpha subunit family protein [Heracleum sosnowskyi]